MVPDAHASTDRGPRTIAQQAAQADVIAAGSVERIDTRDLDDGLTVTLVRISVTELIRGSVPTRKLSLGLPGAFIDGEWVGAVGLEPSIAVGDTLLVFGDIVDAEHVQMLAGPQSVFERTDDATLGGRVVDYDGNPLVEVPCSEPRTVARPSTEQAVVVTDAECLPEETPGIVFTDDRAELALPWRTFVDSITECVADLGLPDDRAAVGGGW